MSDDTQIVLTPSVRRVLRRSLFWVGALVVLLIIALTAILTGKGLTPDEPMSARSAAPGGAKALVEVLRHEGVTVKITDSLEATKDAITDGSETTLFVYDPNSFLSLSQRKQLIGLAADVVLLDPASDFLRLISPDIAQAGYVGGTLTADCSVDAAEAAEEITAYGYGFRIVGENVDAVTCFGSGDGVYSLVQVEDGLTTYTVLGATDALTNGTITQRGNAALGLNLLGGNENLVWYIPTAEDLPAGDPTYSELSPDWVVPVSITALLVGLAAMFWRGRRFGPLVVENLPVTVRASETMQGRARLYERASARTHTLDSLRIGTVARLAKKCGLPVLATVDEVALAVAAIAGRDPREIRALLVDTQPTTDHALVRLSDELLKLEKLVALNSRPH